MSEKVTLPLVSIIIPVVGYSKLPDYLVKSLLSLDYPKKKFEVLLIKMKSQQIKVDIQGVKTRYINNSKKMGYSQAVNLGAKESRGKYIFLINPDIKIAKTALRQMVLYLIQNSKVGVVGPRVHSLSSPSQVSSFDLPEMNFNKMFGMITPVYAKQIAELKLPQEVDWVSGCAMFFSKDLWKQISGFDERFFIYWEDADFCLRAKKRGFKSILLPRARVWHAGSLFMSKVNPRKVYYLAKNGRLFMATHSGLPGQLWLHMTNILATFAKIIRFIFQPEKKDESRAFLLGVLDFYLGKTGVTTRSF